MTYNYRSFPKTPTNSLPEGKTKAEKFTSGKIYKTLRRRCCVVIFFNNKLKYPSAIEYFLSANMPLNLFDPKVIYKTLYNISMHEKKGRKK